MNRFSYEPTPNGVILSLSHVAKKLFSTTAKQIRVGDWASGKDTGIKRGLIALNSIYQGLSDSQLNSTTLKLDHEFVANLSEDNARALALPPSVPHQIHIRSIGKMIDGTYDLESQLLDGLNPAVIDERIGSILKIGRINYRVPSPIYDILNEIKNFGGDNDEKWERIAKIVGLLGIDSDSGVSIEPEMALANIRIRHVAAFSARATGDLQNDLILAPVLFARHLRDEIGESGNLLDESEQILNPEQAKNFSEQFMRGTSKPRTYLLSTGEYVYIDPSIREALSSFRAVCKSSHEVKKAFLRSPRAVMLEMADNPGSIEESLQLGFLETAQFSERVIGIGELKPIELPFYVETTNDWGIEFVLIRQDGIETPIVIPKGELDGLMEDLKKAMENGISTISVDGRDIPVSEELITAIGEILPERPDLEENDDDEKQEKDTKNNVYIGAISQDNFEYIKYKEILKLPDSSLSYVLPRVIKPSTMLLQHQEEGFNWLIDCYNTGLPGVLLADDMGLGKTLQTLVFLAAYREQIPEHERTPLLLVAPTGLLGNWLNEIDKHLLSGGLGKICKVYGSSLQKLRRSAGRDINWGLSLLDTEKIRQADIVLTTYETQRDYQVSFAQIEFGMVVFDEIQKTKNPKSLVSRCATTINARFKIGLSGTPVENSIADLWTLMDVVAAGFMKRSLKDFVSEFAGDPSDEKTRRALDNLHRELLKPRKENPPPILRRLKGEVFKGVAPDGSRIPEKVVMPSVTTMKDMPLEQADLYTEHLNHAVAGRIPILKALAAFRRISLAPREPEDWIQDEHGFIDSSARLAVAFQILDKIKEKKEKAIIFLETIAFQDPLSQILKERYKLEKHPLIINGAISGPARQDRVDEFQEGSDGFDAIIMSPKAGGIGLTLTAANHVLHLERWWNPAVEDQCNDRAYRIGQKKDVKIYTPMSVHSDLQDKSFDIVLDKILSQKRLLAQSFLVPTEVDPDIMFGKLVGKAENQVRYNPRTLEESYEIESGEGFEQYIAGLLTHHGFRVKLTPRTGDKGCDLVAHLGSKKAILQCKQVRSEKTILNRGVEEIAHARLAYPNSDAQILVTNAVKLSRTQKDLAREHDVLIADGRVIENAGVNLADMMRKKLDFG